MGHHQRQSLDVPNETTPILVESTREYKPDELEEMGPSGYGIRPFVAWFKMLQAEFGGQLLGFLFFSQHLTKGFVHAFVGAGGQYIFKEYSINAARVGVYSGVMMLPWALKPVIGLLSDFVPIFGYAKSPYIAIATIIGTAALSTIGAMRHALTIEHFVMLGFCISLYASTVDLLTEAAYSKVLRAKPKQGPALLSYVWGGLTVMGAIAIIASGYILVHSSPWTLYQIGALPASFVLFPAIMNWLKEPCLTDEQIREQRAKICAQREVLVLCFVMAAATISLSWSGMMLNVYQGAIVSLIVTAVVLISFSLLLNPMIAKVNAFGIIQMCLGIDFGGAGFYFAMDTPEEYPDGPHFSKTFYNIVLPLCGSVFTVIGIALYQRNAKDWKYAQLFMFGNAVSCIFSLFDVLFYSRLNKTALGIDDHYFVLGASSIQTIIGAWLWMPQVVIMSQLCPSGMEAIMFAILAGCHNLGGTIAANFGSLVLELKGITPKGANGEGAQFNDLWQISLLSSVLSACTICLIPYFIPDKKQTTRLLLWDDQPSNFQSVWRRWRGYNDVPPDHITDSSEHDSEDGRPVMAEA